MAIRAPELSGTGQGAREGMGRVGGGVGGGGAAAFLLLNSLYKRVLYFARPGQSSNFRSRHRSKCPPYLSIRRAFSLTYSQLGSIKV
jgi:hypothetical protein